MLWSWALNLMCEVALRWFGNVEFTVDVFLSACWPMVGLGDQVVGCWFSIMHLWINLRVCVLHSKCVNLFKCVSNYYNQDFSMSARHFITGICVVALVPARITMSGAIFHPFVMKLFMIGWYFVVFLVMNYPE